MGTVVVRNSVAKRVIVTLMPAISFLCMFGLAAISVNFLEYGSTADRIVGYIGVSCIIPMIVSIPFIFKVNREKTVLDINTFYVTPFVAIDCLGNFSRCKIIGKNSVTTFYDNLFSVSDGKCKCTSSCFLQRF